MTLILQYKQQKRDGNIEPQKTRLRFSFFKNYELINYVWMNNKIIIGFGFQYDLKNYSDP